MTVYHPPTHDPIVRHLFQCGLSDAQIGERIGMSKQTVRRARERMQLGAPTKGYRKGSPLERLPSNGPDENNPVVVARLTLGKRIEERSAGYFLEGVPISTPDMVREANRVRVSRGQNQFGPSNWRVDP